jgi:hypothetical protein
MMVAYMPGRLAVLPLEVFRADPVRGIGSSQNDSRDVLYPTCDPSLKLQPAASSLYTHSKPYSSQGPGPRAAYRKVHNAARRG